MSLKILTLFSLAFFFSLAWVLAWSSVTMTCITCEIATVPNSVLLVQIVFTCEHSTGLVFYLLCWNLFYRTFFVFVSDSISTSPVYGSVLCVVQNVQCICEKCILSSLKVLASKRIMAEKRLWKLLYIVTGASASRYSGIELHLHS